MKMNRQQDRGRLVCCSLVAALALLCLLAATIWFALSAQPKEQKTGYLLRDNGGHLALYAADFIFDLA